MNVDKKPRTLCTHEVEIDDTLLSQPIYRALIDLRLFLAQLNELRDLRATAEAVIAQQKEELAG